MFFKNLKKRFSKKGSKSKVHNSLVEPVIDIDNGKPAEIVIVGAGIVGLVLALSLEKQLGIKAELFEQAEAFHDDVGAGMGMYPNGLRVIRDISKELLEQIQQAGYPYLYRRWERHDGTEVAVAEEKVLAGGDDDLKSIGIRRWKLQKVLFNAVQDAGIRIHFGKRLRDVKHVNDEVNLQFEDGTSRTCKLLLAADGAHSRVRRFVTGINCNLKYSGTQCLMGTASVAREERGLCLPSSQTSKCHGAFYPVTATEQCFQFHFPVCEEDAKASYGAWGGLTEHVGKEECEALAEKLIKEGWNKKYLEPLYHMNKAIKIGLQTLEPTLETFVHGQVALVGDAAHPPVPYLGQGAQQGLEDAGTMALLLKKYCLVESDSELGCSPTISLTHLDEAFGLYDKIRVPRTRVILEQGKAWGAMQQKRAENPKYNIVKEQKIQRDVFFHETSPAIFVGVHHDYKEDVEKVVAEAHLMIVPEEKEDVTTMCC